MNKARDWQSSQEFDYSKEAKMERKAEIKQQMLALASEYGRLCEQEKNNPKSYVPASGKNIGAEELCNMIEASLDMNLTAGRFNRAFEEALAQKLGVNFALTTNSGSSANLIAFSALTSPLLGDKRLKRGDEVICVAAGFPTTLNPVIQNGLTPVFVDVQVGTYNIDVKKMQEAVSPKTKAVFLAHTLGNMFDLEAVIKLAAEHDLWVIEDTCDALGARWNGKYAGTFGHIATCSFYPAHHLTMGEGGAVLTNDFKLWKIIVSMRDWGRDCWCQPGCDNTCKRRFEQQLGKLPAGYDHKYTYSHIGYNLKITDWQAAIGLAQIAKLDKFLDLRREHAEFLLKALDDLKDYLILPCTDDRCDSAWFGFLISIKEDAPFTRSQMVPYLESHGIGTRLLFAGNILRQPMLALNHIPCRIGSDSAIVYTDELDESSYQTLPVTEFIMNQTFWVGVAQNLNKDDLKRTSQVIHEFVRSKVNA